MLGGKDQCFSRSLLSVLSGWAGWARWGSLGGLAWVAWACSSPPTLEGAGGRCMQIADCQLGFVCVYQSDGTGTCSDKTSALVMTEDAGSATTGTNTGTTAPPPDDAAGMDPDAAAPMGTDDAATSDEPPPGD